MLALAIRRTKQAAHSELHVVLPDAHCVPSEPEALLEQPLWSVEALQREHFFAHGADALVVPH